MVVRFEVGKKYIETIYYEYDTYIKEWECIKRTKCFVTVKYERGGDVTVKKLKIRDVSEVCESEFIGDGMGMGLFAKHVVA